MKVLIGCEFSAKVRDAFRARGHDAYSCDLLPCEGDPQFHLQCDVLELLAQRERWDLGIFHPDCTYLNNAGRRWLYEPDSATKPLKGAPRWAAMRKAAEFFLALQRADIPRICIENPIMHDHAFALIGSRATQFVQPWQFGYQELKATGLHLKNLPPLVPTKVLQVPRDPAVRRLWARVHQASPGPDRWKERSRTNPGIAAAMAEQWENL